MKKHTQSNQYSIISIKTEFLLLIMLVTFLSSCSSVIQAPLPTQPEIETTQSEQTATTQELTLIPETETAIETDLITLIEIDMDNIIYPPVGYVKEYFEKGE